MEPSKPAVSSIQHIAEALQQRLLRYIEATYPLRDIGLIEERRALLKDPGIIAQQPYIESTPTYATGLPYHQLGLPSPIGETLAELATFQPSLGVFARPFEHRAAALRAFFCDQRDLIVVTGTGSGKTETFLLPVLGQLLEEAAQRPASFAMPGCRALLLYPMNALVSDQLARLRRLFGDQRLHDMFLQRYQRTVRFGMYTSRTPYPGIRSTERDRQQLEQVLGYYIRGQHTGDLRALYDKPGLTIEQG